MCLFPPGLSCSSYKFNASNGGLAVDIGQSTGHRITINNMTCTQEATSPPPISHGTLASAVSVGIGDKSGLQSLRCYDKTGTLIPSDDIGDTIKVKLWVNYTEVDTTMTRTAIADVAGRYE